MSISRQLQERVKFVREQSSSPRFSTFDVLDLRALLGELEVPGESPPELVSNSVQHLSKRIKKLDDWPTEHLPRWQLGDVEAVEALIEHLNDRREPISAAAAAGPRSRPSSLAEPS